MSDRVAVLAASIELILVFTGLSFSWRFVLSPSARARRQPSSLPAWDAPVHEFLLFLFVILFGAMTAAFIAGGYVDRLAFVGDQVTVLNGTAAQLGMLAGIGAYRFGFERGRNQPASPTTGVLASGGATFLIALPVLTVTSLAWQELLKRCGLPAERQDLIEMFAHIDSPMLLVIMITLAIGMAPVTEELLFRAGLFRYFRTRMPRWLALGAPALVFALLHVNWETLEGFASIAPLMVLAIIFSLAYERTGRIGTSMVAHALFNLNTILLIFAGVGI